jgi:hypothetical protein
LASTTLNSQRQRTRRRRDEDQQRHGGEILHDQQSDRGVAAGRAFDAPLPQQRGPDRGAREHDRGGERDRMRKVRERRDRPSDQREQAPQREVAGESDGTHGAQLARREAQSQTEEQKDQAELGEGLDRAAARDVTRRERPDGDPRHDVTDDGIDAQARSERTAAPGRDEGDGQIAQELELVVQLRSGSRPLCAIP